MNDQTGYPAQEAGNTQASNSADGSIDNGSACDTRASCGCCQKMMTACRDLCTRFLDTRISVSYSMTTRIHGGGKGQGSAKDQTQGQKPQGTSAGGEKNQMTKEGTIELRALDLTVGLVMACTFLTVMAMLKGLCGRR